MRLGGPVKVEAMSPATWVEAHRQKGYAAAFCPVTAADGDDAARAYAEAARQADLVIAEVGAWSDPLSDTESVRRASIEHCKRQLALADLVGAKCCVNVSGARGEHQGGGLTPRDWAGPHPANLTDETFEQIVATVREIIDDVKPTRTFYALETMPWMYPDSPQTYLRLIHAIGRERFAVHLDPVNLVSSPQRYFLSGALIRECFETLGPHIRSCHAKDILLDGKLTVHLSEVRPGQGGLDYRTFLREVEKISPDLPVMLEHLPNAEEYDRAAAHVRQVAAEVGVTIK